MKFITRTNLLSYLFIAFLVFNSCSKDDEPNSPPVIQTGNDIIGMTGTTINLSVTATDPDNNPLSYSWNVIESPAGSSANLNSTGPNATFNTTTAGFYRVQVTVDDGKGGTASGIIQLYIGGVLPTSISANTSLPDLFEDEQYPDYYATSSIQVTAGLTIAPGVVIESGADVRLWFNGNSSYINAEGTAAKNIVFRGMDKVKGSWRLIEITSNNVNNKFNYVRILHTGSSASSNQKTAVLVKSNVSGRLSIKNTSISESDGYALYIDGNTGTFSEFENNNFSNNTLAPLRIGAEGVIKLDHNSVYTNNGIQAIEVTPSGNTNVRFENTGTIKAVGIPYHFLRSAELRTTLTFEAGVTCLFEAGMRLWVTDEGALIADGTAASKITFSGLTQSSGAWYGIEIASPSTLNLINHGIISHGGSNAGRGANIYMFGSSAGSQLTITNSSITNSQTWGIQTATGTINLTESGNTFSNNASGNILMN